MRCKDNCLHYEVCEDGQLYETPCVHLKNKQEIKSEAYKELAKRIKKHLMKNCFIWCSEVDKIVEEMEYGSTENTFTEIKHNSLCETETFEGR